MKKMIRAAARKDKTIEKTANYYLDRFDRLFSKDPDIEILRKANGDLFNFSPDTEYGYVFRAGGTNVYSLYVNASDNELTFQIFSKVTEDYYEDPQELKFIKESPGSWYRLVKQWIQTEERRSPNYTQWEE